MKRICGIAATVIGLVLCICGCGRNSADSFQISAVNNYTEIPGVTQQDIDDIEAIKQRVSAFSYGHMLETEAFMLPDGTFSGFVYKLCDMLTNLFGVEFVPEYHESWDSLKGDFDSMKTDFNGELTATSERMMQYAMSHTIAERSLKLFSLTSSDKIRTEEDVSGFRIGFLTGSITAQMIRKSYGINFTEVDVTDCDEAARMLESGEIDVFVTDAVVEPMFDQYDFIQSQLLFQSVYTSVSMATANPELEPIIRVVDKYIVAGGIDELYKLYKEGSEEYIVSKLNNSFTEEEKAYIASKISKGEKVKTAFEADNYPVSFYNEKDDEFQGIAVDLLVKITQLTGLEFESVTDKNTMWNNIVELLRSGDISMVSELIYSEERKKDFIWTDMPILSSNYALLSKASYPELMPQQVVHTKVGVSRGTIYEDIYRAWFPSNQNLIMYDTQNDAFAALEKGEIDLLMATETMLLTQTNYREKSGFKVNLNFNTQIDSLLGFNKNETVLCSIIDKSLRYIDVEAFGRRWTNRSFDYAAKMANMRFIYLLIFSVALLLILSVIVFLLMQTKRLGIDLKRQTEEAKVASKAKSAFLAHMSHEIRTPLNAVIGMAGIAKRSVDDKEKTVTAINQIIASSNHLLGILNDVLDMSKIESGKIEIIHEPFSLLEAFGDVNSIILQRCHEKDIRFITNITDMNDMTLVGDRLRINQVLINLLSNAVKFTDNGGEVRLLVNATEKADDCVGLRFTVSDNGIGMSEEQIQKLFVPFEQGSSTVAAKYGGTGLGLSISQNLVKMMGGVITVQSEPKRGSKFCFELTIKKSSEAVQDLPEFCESIALPGKVIMLVEDIEINRMIMCEMLGSTGVEIHEAENGNEALEMFEKSPAGTYDLIFMDIQMPQKNGYEAAKELREMDREDAKTVPIIAMTANVYKETVDELLSAGMNGHLPKPIDMRTLMKTLGTFLK